ncbi:hypothetical protein QBC40DRAFT_325475 [Triangularia verruculosa]|uniref:Protein kinase domain-containing protein n=1 Tax=Triangularia verruculosa TaxID=2587418 RepID=A0AAN6XLX3_9PEZI|nr:hypothetical protein QBC40DRAFT_325475 [Triangularia verruculosa]
MASPNKSTMDSGLGGLDYKTPPDGDRQDNRGWHSLTLAVYPLKRREIAKRKKLLDENSPNKSLTWLKERQNGFGLIRPLTKGNFFAKTGGLPMLFYSIDKPRELLVIKQVAGNVMFRNSTNRQGLIPEIEYMNLEDPETYRVLQHDPILCPVSEMYAIQIHSLGTRFPTEPGAWYGDAEYTLFMKYYNGGELIDLITQHQKGRQLEDGGFMGPEKVPEAFIWHYIAQIGRAYAYLHTGHVNSPEHNIKKKNHLNRELKHPTLDTWTPIAHNDGHLSNIWLHYPSAEQKKDDPRLKVFDEKFPQIVLADFGQAHDVAHDPLDDYRAKDVPDAATWYDKMNFGFGLKMLLLAFDPNVIDTGPDRECIFNMLADENKNKKEGVKHARVATCPITTRKYSIELCKIAAAFEDMMDFAYEGSQIHTTAPFYHNYANNDVWVREKRWENWPSNDWLYGWVIAMADHKLEEHRKTQEEKKKPIPVMWTKGITTTVPYRAYGPQRWPFTATEDFQYIHMSLVAMRVALFPQWPPGSVEIKSMRPRGGLYHDLVHTIHRSNDTLSKRRKAILKLQGLKVGRQYKYPLVDDFEICEIDEDEGPRTKKPKDASTSHESPGPHSTPSLRPEDTSGSHGSLGAPHTSRPSTGISTSSSGIESQDRSTESEQIIQAQVKKSLKENYLLMARHLSKLDYFRSSQVDIMKRGALTGIAKYNFEKLEKQVDDMRKVKKDIWMKVERRKLDALRKSKAQEDKRFQKKEQKIKSKGDSTQSAEELKQLREAHSQAIDKIDKKSQHLATLIKWWKDQLALIKAQEFIEGEPPPAPRDTKSKPEGVDTWDDEDPDSSASFEDSTILPEPEDPEYEKRATDRMKRWCDYILEVGYLEDPDMSVKDLVDQPSFWTEDDKILPEVEAEKHDNTFVEGKSMQATAELKDILEHAFFSRKDGSLDVGDMDTTIRDLIAAADETTVLDPDNSHAPSAKRTTITHKKIPLAEYYRKLYAGENPWEDGAGGEEDLDDDDTPVMAKASRVVTMQEWEQSPDDGIETLSRNLQISTERGQQVIRTLPGRYTGTVPVQTPGVNVEFTPGAHVRTDQFLRGREPLPTVESHLDSAMGYLMQPQPSRAVFNSRDYSRALYLEREGGGITLEEYTRRGRDRILNRAILLEERIREENVGGIVEDGKEEVRGTKRERQLTLSGPASKRRRAQ